MIFCSYDSIITNTTNIINALCQIIIAVAAIVAIIITIKQIQSKKKSNISVSYSVALGLAERKNGDHEIIEGLNIRIRNLGIAPIYYSGCGIMFVKDRKPKKKTNYPGIMIAELDTRHNGMLKPGDSVLECTQIIDEFILIIEKENQILNNYKVYIYVNLCNGKNCYWNTGDTYINFKEKHLEMNDKRIKGNEDMKSEEIK